MISLLNNLCGLLASAPHVPVEGGVGLHRKGSTFVTQHDMLFWFIFWLSVFFFVLLMGLSAYFIFKYRRRPGVPAQRSASHNTPLELTWSVVPLVILLGLFFWAFHVYMDMHMAPGDAEEINVTAQKWAWSWVYDNGAEAQETRRIADQDVPVFAVPADKPVRLIMHSTDVIHSLYVPDFRVKLDVFPMRYTTMWFEASKAGEEHYLFCAEYCGSGHSQMGAVIKVLEMNDYLQWKQDNTLDDALSPVELGGILYRTRGCNACHATDDRSGEGPGWAGIYGSERRFTDGSTTTADENYLRSQILDPSGRTLEGYRNVMPSYQGMPERELNALIAFIKSLSAKGREELDAVEEEIEAALEEAEEDENSQD
ncbi:MAG: cytochrome c oxidase subunit II [Phycisphaeraceae bacterium]|nr:MAG: cytochrome c oxidase subunit II [Phycisphaeraceae bacterium]